MLIMFVDLYYRQPALTLSPCVTQPIIAEAILLPGLNDATSAAESFLVLSFPHSGEWVSESDEWEQRVSSTPRRQDVPWN